MVTTLRDLAIGDRWGYRQKRGAPLVEVEVQQVGTDVRARRTKVQHLDDRYEGRSEWIPATRLLVRWDDREAFQAHEAVMERLYEAGRPPPGAHDEALFVLNHYLDERTELEFIDGWSGVARIRDAGRVAELTGEELQASDGETWDGFLHVPWPVTERLAISMLQRHGAEYLALLEDEAETNSRRYEVALMTNRPLLTDEERLALVRAEEVELRERREAHTRRWAHGTPRLVADENTALRLELSRAERLLAQSSARLGSSRSAIERRLADDIASFLERPRRLDPTVVDTDRESG